MITLTLHCGTCGATAETTAQSFYQRLVDVLPAGWQQVTSKAGTHYLVCANPQCATARQNAEE